MSRWTATAPALLIALALCAAPGVARAGTCGVLPFSADEGVKRGAAPNITALVSSELDIRGGYDLVMAAPAEDFEGGDCGASTSCIKEFGRANKHEAVVAGHVAVSGDEYLLTLKLHDANTAGVIRTVERNVPQSALALADAIPDVVIELATGQRPEEDGVAAEAADEGPLFDDLDFDDLMEEAEEEVAEERPKKRKRSRAAPRNPDLDDEVDLDDEEDDPFGIDELDALDMSADEIAKKKEAMERQAELERMRKAEEERLARERAEEERRRRIAEEREREERERMRREREERERIARVEAERRAEEERQRRIREEREREERARAQAERERREREERERQARADREDRERREREAQAREAREREERERQARADRDRERQERERREREERERQAREERERRNEEPPAYASTDEGGGVVLGSALSSIVIGGGDEEDEDDESYGGIEISSGDDYEVEDEEPRAGMIIGDDDEYENPNVRRRREAGVDREDAGDDRYARARSFGSSSQDDDYDRRDDDYDRRDDGYDRRDDGYSSSRSYRAGRDDDEDADLDALDDDEDYGRDAEDRSYDRDYDDRSYTERSYGSERIASRDDRYLSDSYDAREDRSYSSRRTGAQSNVSRSTTGWGNRPWFSARVGGGYTNYYLHFAQYGVDLGVFPHPRISVDLKADFWTLSIRECPECEQQYRTLPSFYLGGSYRFTNLKIVQPYAGADVGTVVYAIGTLTDEAGNITRRPLMGFAFAVKGGADFMFTRHFGIGAGVRAGLAHAARIKENVHPDWNPLQFLVNVHVAAVVQF